MKPIRAWQAKRKEDLERQRIKDFLSTAVVVFRCSEQQAAVIDVAVGPCVPRVGPRGGRIAPLASPLYQMHSNTLAQVAALYTVLTGRPSAEALENHRTQRQATLARFSERFAAGLAELGTIRTSAEATLATQEGVAKQWNAAVPWDATMQVGGVSMRVLSWAGVARLAREKGQRVYCWQGPAVPVYVIAHGVGHDSYDAYKRDKRG